MGGQWVSRQKIAQDKLLLNKPQRRSTTACRSSPGLELQEDIAAQKVPCGGRLGGARDELGCKDMYNILVSFICYNAFSFLVT